MTCSSQKRPKTKTIISHYYPPVIQAIENDSFIVDLPIFQVVIFQSYVNIYQRVICLLTIY